MSETGLVRQLAYKFKDKNLLARALTHRSYSGNNNERLEFLGDGVLNFLVAHQLYQRFPNLPEGDLSRLRAELVKEQTLSEIATGLSVGEFLNLGEGELKSGGWRRPSVLADAMEAIIGAVFLDGGYPAAAELVGRLLQRRLENINPKSIGKDAKSLLQECLQAQKLNLPEYAVLAIEGEAHCQIFRVSCHIPELEVTTEGKGSSRRAAEQQAAQLAYEKIAKKGKK
ncbi:RNAse III [Methylobacillus rhizosphaerae]|uniref:Ribonuclease 3 n=1 Tax=Methylobacillus rhizosphaerae TaxID=551994 RepID=A0A238YZ64_9PROT|nr:ribonuclease III [Methylobacillus rhizosphaerae]SNR76360.1 RNAse III [Methylobacillus rhizosphaerae]